MSNPKQKVLNITRLFNHGPSPFRTCQWPHGEPATKEQFDRENPKGYFEWTVGKHQVYFRTSIWAGMGTVAVTGSLTSNIDPKFVSIDLNLYYLYSTKRIMEYLAHRILELNYSNTLWCQNQY